jgi:hypothetical protein
LQEPLRSRYPHFGIWQGKPLAQGLRLRKAEIEGGNEDFGHRGKGGGTGRICDSGEQNVRPAPGHIGCGNLHRYRCRRDQIYDGIANSRRLRRILNDQQPGSPVESGLGSSSASTVTPRAASASLSSSEISGDLLRNSRILRRRAVSALPGSLK